MSTDSEIVFTHVSLLCPFLLCCLFVFVFFTFSSLRAVNFSLSHPLISPLLFVASWWPSIRRSVSAVARRARWTSGSRPSSDASTGTAWQTERSSRHLNPKWWVTPWSSLWLCTFSGKSVEKLHIDKISPKNFLKKATFLIVDKYMCVTVYTVLSSCPVHPYRYTLMVLNFTPMHRVLLCVTLSLLQTSNSIFTYLLSLILGHCNLYLCL